MSGTRRHPAMRDDVTGADYDVAIDADAWDDQALVSHRGWREHVPR